SMPPQPYHIHEKKYHKYWFPQLRQFQVWHNPFQSSPFPKTVAKNNSIKKVLTIHDLNALHEGKTIEVQQKSLARTQTLIDQSDAIICISNFVLSDVQKNCRVDNKNFYVIHNGAGTSVQAA